MFALRPLLERVRCDFLLLADVVSVWPFLSTPVFIVEKNLEDFALERRRALHDWLPEQKQMIQQFPGAIGTACSTAAEERSCGGGSWKCSEHFEMLSHPLFDAPMTFGSQLGNKDQHLPWEEIHFALHLFSSA